MLSWTLWRLLEAVPTSRPTHRLLSVKAENTPVPAVVTLIGIGGFCLCMAIPYILIPLAITLSGLRFSIRIAGSIAKQYEVGNYELLSVTPVGALGFAIEISHLYTIGTRLILQVGRIIGGAIVLAMGVTAAFTALLSFFSGSANFVPGILLALILGFGIFSFVQEYVHLLALGVAVGIFAGSLRERNAAQLAAASSYITIQLASYLGLWLSLNAVTGMLTPLTFHYSIKHVITAGCVGLVYFGVREVIIFALWHQVLLRFNDDTALFNMKAL